MTEFSSLLSFSTVTYVLIGTAVAVLTLFLALIDLAAESWASPLDRQASRFIVRHRSRGETRWMQIMSLLGGPFGLAFMVGAYLWFALQSNQALLGERFLLLVFSGALYVLLLKLVTARKRPTFHVLEVDRTYSFPSAHSFMSTFVYLSLGLAGLQYFGGVMGEYVLGAIVVLLAAIGLSRVYLGVHYISDVLAGFVGGTVWVGIFWLLINSR